MPASEVRRGPASPEEQVASEQVSSLPALWRPGPQALVPLQEVLRGAALAGRKQEPGVKKVSGNVDVAPAVAEEREVGSGHLFRSPGLTSPEILRAPCNCIATTLKTANGMSPREGEAPAEPGGNAARREPRRPGFVDEMDGWGRSRLQPASPALRTGGGALQAPTPATRRTRATIAILGQSMSIPGS